MFILGIRSIAAAGLLVLMVASAAPGQTATWTLHSTPDSPGSASGTYALFLAVSPSDNFGVASYSVRLNGELTFDHRAPGIAAADGPAGNNRPAGFTVFRTPDQSATVVGLTVSGSQDTITPTPYIYYRVGQTAGDVLTSPTQGPITVSAVGDATQSSSYAAPLIVGVGTWQGSPPTFDRGNVDNGVQVFTADTALSNTAASLNFSQGPRATSVPASSPASLVALVVVFAGVGVWLTRGRDAGKRKPA